MHTPCTRHAGSGPDNLPRPRAGYRSARTGRPRRWAQECMRKFEVGPVGSGVYIKDVMQLEEIRKGNKSAPIYAYIHIYICICVCVCVCV